MLNFLLRPLQNLGLRILLIFIALVLFMVVGLRVASWLAGPQTSNDWLSVIPLVIAGGLLLFKARSPGNSPK